MDEDLGIAMMGKQKVSRADLEGLIGLVISYSVIPIGRMFATSLIV